MKILKFLSLMIMLAFWSSCTLAQELSIAVASNFTNAAQDIVSLFEKTTGHRVKVSFGSTGNLYAQIKNGAPFEVFLAADKQHPTEADKAGLTELGTRFTYARGKLVMWSGKNKAFSNGEAYVKGLEFSRVAIANPQTAPYGLAAKQVMEYLGIWEKAKSKLIQGDNISQVFQFAATNNVDIGFVAFSQVKAWKNSTGTLWKIPQAYYTPIVQQAVLLKKGKNNPAALAFIDFLKSSKARQVITSYGYIVE